MQFILLWRYLNFLLKDKIYQESDYTFNLIM